MKCLLIILFSLSLIISAQEAGDVDYVFASIAEADKTPDVVYQLSLSKGKLEVFPENLSRFSNLKSLDLSKNKISLLPAEIGKLKSLEELNLSKNKIYNLPFQLKELTELKVLLLSRNDVEEIPKEVGEMLKLETLDLWSNNVKRIDPNIQNLTNLKVFDLRGMLLSDEMKKNLVEWLPNATIQFSGGCDCGF
ncbi:MAG: leucine-rich repeat domain-containing protein [Flavobacteriales bacterium]|nr:leucine-rich repeat domain-containing protein [Flavobacteriales bacterium]